METIYLFFIADTTEISLALALPVSADFMGNFQYDKPVRNFYQKTLSENQEHY